jgi:hypothetical protein
MRAYLLRASVALQTDLSAIDGLFHALRYGGDSSEKDLKRLKRLCRTFKPKL